MLALGIEPVRIDPTAASSPAAAHTALAGAAAFYLDRLADGVTSGQLRPRSALVTRVRGTGPGVSFGSLVDALRRLPLRWACPFEGSSNVSGATISGVELLGDGRKDGFIFLRFAPGTRDLPLHIHPSSDRFIYVTGGRGFFHLAPDPLDAILPSRVAHMPVRDRDALMFSRGAVHTFHGCRPSIGGTPGDQQPDREHVLRTKRTNRPGSRRAASAMPFKLIEKAQVGWRKLNGSEKRRDLIDSAVTVDCMKKKAA